MYKQICMTRREVVKRGCKAERARTTESRCIFCRRRFQVEIERYINSCGRTDTKSKCEFASGI